MPRELVMVFSRKSDPKSFTVVPPEIKNEAPLQQAALPPPAPSGLPDTGESLIGKDLSIEGPTITIRCKGCLRVNGTIHADLHCVELIVGEQAVIKGSIAAEDVRIFGRVTGAVAGAQVIVHSTAQVDGDITSQSLTIEAGASFDGRSRKVTDLAEVTPQLEAPVDPNDPQVIQAMAASEDAPVITPVQSPFRI